MTKISNYKFYVEIARVRTSDKFGRTVFGEAITSYVTN
jgi:hypothetical protein